MQEGVWTSLAVIVDFMAPVGQSRRQAFFARYSTQAVRALQDIPNAPLVLLTGGLRSPAVMRGALAHGHAHLIGVGRGSVVCPDLPVALAQEKRDRRDRRAHDAAREPDLTLPRAVVAVLRWVPVPKLIGAGAGMAWYIVQMRRVATDRPVDFSLGGLGAIVHMWADPALLPGALPTLFAAIAVLALVAIVFTDVGRSAGGSI
jgi:hypothetical protein